MTKVTKNWLKIALILAAACGLLLLMDSAEAAGAQSDDVSWALPTQRVDGTPLPPEELEYTEVELWKDGAVIGYERIPAPGTTFTYNRPLPPNYEMCYAARVKALEPAEPSDWTGLVCKTVKARPNPPGQLDVK